MERGGKFRAGKMCSCGSGGEHCRHHKSWDGTSSFGETVWDLEWSRLLNSMMDSNSGQSTTLGTILQGKQVSTTSKIIITEVELNFRNGSLSTDSQTTVLLGESGTPRSRVPVHHSRMLEPTWGLAQLWKETTKHFVELRYTKSHMLHMTTASRHCCRRAYSCVDETSENSRTLIQNQ
ncbi:hypothetical protein J6590_020106 [Homalodisca vitripennis]|nr:hypothetical protein J6590_020106 [Homalodisca vitripennis]